MAETIIRMRQKQGTSDEWASENPVLTKGEIGLAYLSDSKNFLIKIGNGISTWNTLPYSISSAYRAIETVTLSATLSSANIGKDHDVTAATDLTITIPANSADTIPIGGRVTFWQRGEGRVILLADAGVLLNESLAGSVASARRGSCISLMKVATDSWVADIGCTLGWDSIEVSSSSGTLGYTISDFQCSGGSHVLPLGVLGKSYFLKNAYDASSSATFTASGGQTFDGSTELVLSVGESARISWNGTLWAVHSGVASSSYSDTAFNIYNAIDDTKKAFFSAANILTGTTTFFLPQAGGNLITSIGVTLLQNKTLDNTNNISARDAAFTIQKSTDATALATFSASNLSSGVTTTFILPATGGTFLLVGNTATISNKTIDNSCSARIKATSFSLEDPTNSAYTAVFSFSGASASRTYTLKDVSGNILIQEASSGVVEVSKSSGDALGPELILQKSRGSSTSPTATLSGDTLGHLSFGGYHTSYSPGARIVSQALEDWSAGSAEGTHMYFQTTHTGSTNLTTQLTLANNNVILGSGALAPSATSGFLYIAGGPGAPTGTPLVTFTGRVPLYYDTTNDALYAYNGSWKSTSLS